jgi:ABC-type branched-subunit amino acid transport system ATPase component/ABC-type branched-subunit amino acid transport system permease subunit
MSDLVNSTGQIRVVSFASRAEVLLVAILGVLGFLVEPLGAYWTRLVLLTLIYAMAAQGLDLLSGYCGQFSLGHSGLFALGAYGSGITYLTLGVPLAISLSIGVVVSSIGGIILGAPTLRVSGLYLALVTLSFAFIIRNLADDARGITGGAVGIGPLGPDGWIGSHYLVFVSLLFAVSWVMLRRITLSRWGRALVAVREAELLAEAIGVRTWRLKVTTFGFSAAVTGLAGGLYAHIGYISPHAFGWERSLLFLVIIFLGGIGTLTGALLGSVIVVFLPEVLTAQGEPRLIAYGLVLIVVMLVAPTGILGGLRRLGNWAWGRLSFGRDRQALGSLPSGLNGQALPPKEATSPATGVVVFERPEVYWDLEATSVRKYFAGVRAVDGVDLRIVGGRLTGLIGPNGSGKTTLLNCVGGQLKADDGNIRLGPHELMGKDASFRARLGIFRTFQHEALCPSLTLRENVVLGAHRTGSYGLVTSALLSKRRISEENEFREFAEHVFNYVAIPDIYRDRRPSEVPYGLRRLTAIAAALMGKPDFLLLDEPAAGLVEEEIERLEALLRQLLDNGIGIVLVEHHLSLVMALADHVTVLDSGSVIAEGSPKDIAANPLVQQVYLGKEWATDDNVLEGGDENGD